MSTYLGWISINSLFKMPQLKPETISMTGLNLFQHLCNLARLATSALDNASSCEVSGQQPPSRAAVIHYFTNPVFYQLFWPLSNQVSSLLLERAQNSTNRIKTDLQFD